MDLYSQVSMTFASPLEVVSLTTGAALDLMQGKTQTKIIIIPATVLLSQDKKIVRLRHDES